MAGATTRNLTILLTDIEDLTPKTSRETRADILRMLEEHKSLVLPVLEGKGGRLIKTIGDAFLVVFESPTDAVLAGVEV
jgi:class 3 adenylate cyclase